MSDAIAAAIAALIAAVGQTTTASGSEAPQEMLTVKEAAEYLRCSESLIYAQLKDGRMGGVKVGRRRLIPMSEIRRVTEGWR
ncbi:DNA-binding protein [Mycobacteroides chelonae]|uniref:helix-turn-helix domain-containing protein n=1 Tax=Mycobacteroides chelonae TaxID=1774 RepID=UPI0008A87F5B|nr:helix-turn-helix domain-containing protein [Mycobacteroides chelonae]OHU33373.1 DNA-binding protein [Mycobacteroides chelonae]